MLSKKIILISTITLCFSIVGCKEEAKTTKWYRDHPDELKLVYEKCQKSGDASENCNQIKQLNAPTPDLNNLEE